MSLIEKVTLEQRFEDGEGISHMATCDKSIPDEGRFITKTWGCIGSSKFKKQPEGGHWSGPEWGETQELRSQTKPVHRQLAGPEKSHSEITPTITNSKPRGSQSEVFFFFLVPSFPWGHLNNVWRQFWLLQLRGVLSRSIVFNSLRPHGL